MPEGLLNGLVMAAAVAVNLGLAWMAGGLASRQWLKGRTSDWCTHVLVQATSARKLGFAVCSVGLVATLWFETAIMADTALSQAGPAVGSLLTQTHFGHAWLVGAVAWLAVAFLSLGTRARLPARVSLAIALAGLAVFILTRSVVSHAGGGGDWTFDVMVDGLHLTLASAWVGIVFAGARLRLPAESATPQARSDATHWVARMSLTATVALLGIVATGSFKAWRALAPAGSLQAIVGSTYGQALSAKLVLVALAVALGGINRLVVLPRLFRPLDTGDNPAWRERLVAILRFEAATLTVVLVAAAVLSGSEPPGNA